MEIEGEGFDTEVEDDKILSQDANMLYETQTDNEMSHEILRMIITSVQKRERRKSAKKLKRKRLPITTTKENGSEADDERKAYSRCSITFLSKVLQRVHTCPRYVELVKWLGFSEILNLDNCTVPRCFVQWVADNVCTDREVIQIGSKEIKLSPQTVQETLGTPTGDLLVDSDEELGKAAFLAIFGLSEVPSIRFFGKMILAKEVLPDNVFCRCFMSVCLGTFLCPNSSTKLSTKYMGALAVVDKIRCRNWSKFIHEWMIFYIKKYLREPQNTRHLTQTLGGCIYHLAIRSLDFIDFTPVQIPSTLPRIRVWKGNLIKIFSDMYLGTNGKYGAYPVKHISQTCYSIDSRIPTCGVENDEILEQLIDGAIGDLVQPKLRHDISRKFKSIMKNEETKICMKAKDLVIKVIQAIVSNINGSQDTLKISGSEGCSYKTANESQTTVKLSEEDDVHFEDDNADDALVERKKRRTEANVLYETSDGNEHRQHSDRISYCPQASHILLPLHEETKETEGSTSQMFPSASLNHMILGNHISQQKESCVDVSSQVCELNKLDDTKGENLMDLNVKCIEEGNEDLHGSNAPTPKTQSQKYNDINNDHSQGKLHYENVRELDGNLQQNQFFAQSTAIKRSAYLEIARSKYFFQDEGVPSFRLMECVDDNGKTIDEPELFRPVGMDDYSYNEMCELAISKCKEEENKEAENNVTEKEQTTGTITPNMNVIGRTSNTSRSDNAKDNLQNDCEMSIQCAHRRTSITGLTDSSVRNPNFVDLVSPIPTMSSINSFKIEQSCSTAAKSHDYREALIVGRRLFEDNDADYNNSNSRNKGAARELLNNLESSPEVQILGEKSVKYASNSMSNEMDEFYNTSLSLGHSISRDGKENCLPKRIPLRSKYVCSPYDVNPSQSVIIDPFEQKVWQAVTVLCDDPIHKLDWAVNIDVVRVSMLQLGNSMKPKGWVDAWLINVFCRKLFRDNHPSKTKKHFFFNTISDFFLEKWKSEEAKDIWHKRALESFIGANRAFKLHLSDALFFPSIYNRHWFVLLIDIKYRNFIFLDSYFSEDSTFHKTVGDVMIQNFIKTWHEAGLKEMNFQTYGRAYPNVPKQITGNDCGVFVMKFMELLVARNQSKCNFSHLDIPLFRVKYTHDILMSRHNMEHDAKDLASMFEC